MNTDKHGFNFTGARVIAMFGVPPLGGTSGVVHPNRLKAKLRTIQSEIENRKSKI
jgi:hypothetical protein